MSNYTPSLGLEEINPGDQAGLWGNTTNNNLALIDQAIAGVTPVYLDAKSGFTYVLTDYNGAFDEARAAVINVTYASTPATGSNIIQVPSAQKLYVFRNSSGQSIVVQTVAAGSNVTLANGEATLVFCDGTDTFPGIATAGVGTLTVPYGGTGVTSFGGSPGFVYTAGGTSALGVVTAVNLASSSVTGTLPVGNGGTGQTSLTSGALLVGNGSSGISTIPPGQNTYVLTSNGSSWSAQPSSSATYPSAGIAVSTGTAWAASYSGGNPIPISVGGTGQTSAASALGALGGGSLTATNNWSGANTFSTGAFTVNSAASFGGANVFENTGSFTVKSTAITYGLYTGGTTTSNSMFFASNSINFYDADTGNQYNSIYYNATSTALVDQQYNWNYKTPGSSSATNAQIFSGDGGAYKTGGGSWGSISDGRLKENAAPLTGALDKITSLNPVSFSWKFENKEPTVGFIAQEVQQVIPNAVSSHKPTDQEKPFISDRTLKVGWQNDMTAYLVGAIKELKAELDAAKAEIAALKAK